MIYEKKEKRNKLVFSRLDSLSAFIGRADKAFPTNKETKLTFRPATLCH
jgi:hypothetical protein